MTYLPSGRIHPVNGDGERRAGVRARSWIVPGDLLRGARNGLAAGAVFVLAQSFINIALGRPADFYLRMVASFALGFSALVPAYNPLAVSLLGLCIQAALAAAAGAVFTAVSRFLYGSGLGLGLAGYAALGTAFGCAVWLFSYGAVGAALFTQLALLNNFWNGFVAHTFFFGTVLGVLNRLPEDWRTGRRVHTLKEEYHGSDSSADR